MSEGNYMGWSAPLNHPTEWTSHGIIYEPSQNPEYMAGDNEEMYAPDVMQGVDGRYYLYYCFGGSAGHSRIGVAVCDSPAGKYESYGNVQNPDGSVCSDYLMGDPDMNLKMAPIYQMLFHRSLDQVKDLEYPLMGANAYTLEDDMITVKEGPFRILPGQFDTPKDSEFFGHAFYEAASIRKINGRYYFIYSSENSNELCYATSQNYNGPYHFGGTIISNGDVGYHGRSGGDDQSDGKRPWKSGMHKGTVVYFPPQTNAQWYFQPTGMRRTGKDRRGWKYCPGRMYFYGIP